mmetsp:Transcript_65683/g.174026  ORF Transcript_65683/g.174026 Transcript_65683/m.174026 type:complete len:139 (-) Transcript_65683:371-787(-)
MGQQPCCCREDSRDPEAFFTMMGQGPWMQGVDKGVPSKESAKPKGDKQRSPDVVLEFETEDSTRRTVVMTQRPTGVRYRKTLPVTVGEVQDNCQGQALGIKEGWKLLKIDHESTETMSADDVKEFLRNKVSLLPQVKP